MAADDRIKPAVVAALVKDGWTITHDPYPVEYHGEKLSVDLGAEKTIVGAERAGERIAVEIKSFLGPSIMTDFYACLGQRQISNVLVYLVPKLRGQPCWSEELPAE